MSEAQKSFGFQATEPIIRAFERYCGDREFNEFIKALEDRAVTVAIMALSQKDETVNRWLAGRGQELLDIVASYNERKTLRQTEEFLGQSAPDDNPLQGLDQ